MAKKKATKKEENSLNLETILFNCRDYLRGSASLNDKRDVILTLVFLRFIGEKFDDAQAEMRQQCINRGITDEDASLSKSAQAAALANAANGELSHYPRRPRDMSDNMYNLAQEGASSSNIAITSGRMTLPMSIRMYL